MARAGTLLAATNNHYGVMLEVLCYKEAGSIVDYVNHTQCVVGKINFVLGNIEGTIEFLAYRDFDIIRKKCTKNFLKILACAVLQP